MTDDYAGRYWDEVNKVSVSDRDGQNAGEVPGKRELKERVCQACGAVFLSRATNARWCPECRPAQYRAAVTRWQATEHGREVMREAGRRYKKEHPEKVREYARRSYARRRGKVLAWMKEYQRRNSDVIREKKRLAYRAGKGDGGAAFELLKLQGKVEECPRTHSRAVNLPCGREPYCWGGKPCERATSRGCRRPVEASCGWVDF